MPPRVLQAALCRCGRCCVSGLTTLFYSADSWELSPGGPCSHCLPAFWGGQPPAEAQGDFPGAVGTPSGIQHDCFLCWAMPQIVTTQKGHF